MRLSEAIRLGSLTITNPQAFFLNAYSDSTCALGMGLRACGETESPVKVWPWLTLPFGDKHRIAHVGLQVFHYPPCYGSEIAWRFDFDIMRDKTMTLDALCDQVRIWEEELAAKGVNVEQVSMIAELTEPACPIQSTEKVNA